MQRDDSPGIEILDYRYGDSKLAGVRARVPAKGGSVAQWTTTVGSMRRGDELYVKWRIKKTGEIREETVDLRSRLPANIARHRIHFIVRDTQLFIYLISPDKHTDTDPLGPLPMYADRKVATIYPDSMSASEWNLDKYWGRSRIPLLSLKRNGL